MKKITFAQFYETLSQSERQSLAANANTSTQYIYQIATGRRKPGAVTIAKLKGADPRITDSMLRPDLYG